MIATCVVLVERIGFEETGHGFILQEICGVLNKMLNCSQFCVEYSENLSCSFRKRVRMIGKTVKPWLTCSTVIHGCDVWVSQ